MPHFKPLMIGCVLSIIYQYSLWNYHESVTAENAFYWIRLQTSIICVGMPAFLFVFIRWSDQKIPPWLMIVTSLLSILFLSLNLFQPFSLRYSGDLELITYTIFSGEAASRLVGSPGIFVTAFYFYTLFIYAYLIKIVANLIKSKQFALCAMLTSVLCLFIASTILSSLINRGIVNFVLMGGMPFTLLNLLACASIATALNEKTLSLDNQISKRQNLESILSSLAKGVSSTNSNQFFVDMLLELEKISDAKMIYLCVLAEQDGQQMIETKLVIENSHISPNFSVPLNDIHQDLITYDKKLIIKKGLAKRFPEAELFQNLKAEGLINIPLKTNHNTIEGSLVLIFDKSIKHEDKLAQVFDIFSSRAASEIRRNRLESELHQMAFYDFQTKLPNLTQIHRLIDNLYEQNKTNNTYSALILLNLSRFTEVNRQYGFEFAEHAIITLGERLQKYSNEDIVIGRAGGDEFAVLIKNANEGADKLILAHWDAIKRMINAPIHDGGRTVSLSSCAGAVVFPQLNGHSIDVMRCAEIALRQTKQENLSISMFDARILEDMDRKHLLESLLEQAIKTRTELYAVYQPKVNVHGELTGAEALARWTSKDVGIVSPVEFIEIAEHSGLIEKLGYWMIDTVCQQIKQWNTQGLGFQNRIAINISAYQLRKSNFVETVLDILAKHDIQPTQLELELTESGLLTNLEDCIAKLSALRDIGFTIALDDFGTGYSSLSHLKDLPLDVLKIDRSFVNSLDAKKACELARSIISIGHHMSMSIVAEGVEELIQVEKLNEMGCDIFQGYYFSKPMTAKSFFTWATKSSPTKKQAHRILTS